MRRALLHPQLADPDKSRQLRAATEDEQDLRELRQLPGTWANLDPNGAEGGPFGGRGWNCIAVPFIADPPAAFPPPEVPPGRPVDYRLLVNQFNEQLVFSTVDDDVPNRGVNSGRNANVDQFLVALDYEQKISQVAVDDRPESKVRGKPGDAIHHEPGLFLNMVDDPRTPVNTLPLARLGTIPHGDALLALGTARERTGPEDPVIPDFPGLPVGVPQNLDIGYLAPYKHFHENLFRGIYDPTRPTALLGRGGFGGTPFGPEHTIVKTTEFVFDTTFGTGGIHNIPFVISQANASEMKFQMWILEVQLQGSTETVLVLQYAQLVFLDFFPRFDGQPGPIRWPHVSINSLIKVDGPPSVEPQPPPTVPYSEPTPEPPPEEDPAY